MTTGPAGTFTSVASIVFSVVIGTALLMGSICAFTDTANNPATPVSLAESENDLADPPTVGTHAAPSWTSHGRNRFVIRLPDVSRVLWLLRDDVADPRVAQRIRSEPGS